MTNMTRLDDAHEKMQGAPQSDAARLAFYEHLADGELFILLTKEAQGEDIEPEVFEHEDVSYVLIFDREDRLSEFASTATPAPYAALPGRVIVGLLTGQDIGMGVNLGVAPSSILIPPAAITWLSETLNANPDEVEAKITEVSPPKAPEALIAALDTKLATAAGLASHVCLAGVTYEGGRKGHLLGFIDAQDGAQSALAGAAQEALIFCGLEAGEMDVGFFDSAQQIAQKLGQIGMRFDLPAPEIPRPATPSAPGSDPNKPPILK